MAIYRNETQIIGRQAKDKDKKPIPGKQVSIVAKAAYRSGQKLENERTGDSFDYRSRSEEVLHSEILAPANAPDWLKSEAEKHGGGDEDRDTRNRLWNTIEKVERRKDSQLGREFLLALPVELDHDQHVELVRAWCNQEIVSKGFVVDFAIHKSWNEENPHAHILQTLRPLDSDAPEGFGKKPDMSGKFNGRGLVGPGAKADLADWRETWAVAQNTALEKAGCPERVDHRSLADQGIDREPQPKIGVSATAMERKGTPTERGRLSMWAKMDNMLRGAGRSIERGGEVPQAGTGKTWWERAQFATDWTLEQLGDVLRDESSGSGGRAPAQEAAPASYWQNRILAERDLNERDSPEQEEGMEFG